MKFDNMFNYGLKVMGVVFIVLSLGYLISNNLKNNSSIHEEKLSFEEQKSSK